LEKHYGVLLFARTFVAHSTKPANLMGLHSFAISKGSNLTWTAYCHLLSQDVQYQFLS